MQVNSSQVKWSQCTQIQLNAIPSNSTQANPNQFYSIPVQLNTRLVISNTIENMWSQSNSIQSSSTQLIQVHIHVYHCKTSQVHAIQSIPIHINSIQLNSVKIETTPVGSGPIKLNSIQINSNRITIQIHYSSIRFQPIEYSLSNLVRFNSTQYTFSQSSPILV